jgi:hypothetical protein
MRIINKIISNLVRIRAVVAEAGDTIETVQIVASSVVKAYRITRQNTRELKVDMQKAGISSTVLWLDLYGVELFGPSAEQLMALHHMTEQHAKRMDRAVLALAPIAYRFIADEASAHEFVNEVRAGAAQGMVLSGKLYANRAYAKMGVPEVLLAN